jgi:hypothetical protein
MDLLNRGKDCMDEPSLFSGMPLLGCKRFLQHGNGIALLPIAKGQWIKSLWDPDTSCLIAMSPGKDRMTFHHKGKMKEIMFLRHVLGYG